MVSKDIWKTGVRIIVPIVFLLMILGLFFAVTPKVYGQTCGTVSFNQWVSGQTTYYNRTRQYTFYGTARSRVSIWMEQGDYSRIDPYLELKDPYGYIIAADDDSAGNGNSAIRSQYLTSSGCYTIIARSYQDSTYGSFWLYVSR